jgi:hypothetical protein
MTLTDLILHLRCELLSREPPPRFAEPGPIDEYPELAAQRRENRELKNEIVHLRLELRRLAMHN